MKIMHVVEATFAGVGRHIVDLARAQADAGHEVIVLYGTVRESDRFRRARERVTRVQWEPIDVSRRPDKSDLKALQKVRSICRGFQPDVVHGHSTKGGMLARSVPPGPWKVAYTPHAVYSMNPELGRGARSGVDLVERRLAARTDLVIAVSPEEEAHLRIMGIEPAKIRMIPNGIPPIKRARPDLVRRALNLPLDRPVIGFVGRIDDQKAPHTLLDVFKEVAVARARVDFVVVGDGKLRQELQARADISPTLAGRVHLVGEQPGPWAMSGMDVLILPSRYEGMPYVLIEGAHLGLPMVVTRAAGSSLLQDGPATFRLADVGDTRTLADHCIDLIDLWPDRMPGRADQRFTLDAMARLTELAYEGRPINLGRGIRTSGTRPAAPQFPLRPEEPLPEPATGPDPLEPLTLGAGTGEPIGSEPIGSYSIGSEPTDRLPAVGPELPAEPARPVGPTWPWPERPRSDADHSLDHDATIQAETRTGDDAAAGMGTAAGTGTLSDPADAVAPPTGQGPQPWDPTDPDDDLARLLAWALDDASDEEAFEHRSWEPPIDGAEAGPQPWIPQAPAARHDIELTDVDLSEVLAPEAGPGHPLAPVPPPGAEGGVEDGDGHELPEDGDRHDDPEDQGGHDDPEDEGGEGAGPPPGWEDHRDHRGQAEIIDLRSPAPTPRPEPGIEPAEEPAADPAEDHCPDPFDRTTANADFVPPMPGPDRLLARALGRGSSRSATG